jgi:hypothetical protein
MKTKLKPGMLIRLSGSNYVNKILKTWKGYEAGRSERPVIWGQVQRIKSDGSLVKSDTPKNTILEYHYGGPPEINGEIVKK